MKTGLKNLLKNLEKTRQIFWNISPETGKFLNLLIREFNYKTVLEIGTSNGYSGIWLAESLSHNHGTLYTMESHKKERFYLAEKTFKKSGLKNMVQILGHAPEALPKTPKTIDMVFLDATKEEYIEHFKALKNRINKGGMIVADNLYSHPKPLENFVKTIKSEPGWKVFELKVGTGLLIGLRK